MNDRVARDDPASNWEGTDIDIREIFSLIVERIWILVLVPALAAGIALVYLWKAEPQYEATALVEVPQQARKVVEIQEIGQSDFRGDEVLKTIEYNLQRTSLFQRVSKRDDVVRHFGGEGGGAEPAPSPGLRALRLKEQTRVAVVRGTRLISITVESPDPELSRDVANAVVEEFMQERSDSRAGSSQSAFEFLLREAERIGEKLKASENALQGFQPYEDALRTKDRIDVQEQELSQLLQRYGDNHPLVTQSRGRLEALSVQLEVDLARMSGHLDRGTEGGIDAAVGDLTGMDRIGSDLKRLGAQHNMLMREVEIDRELHQTIVGRLNQTNVMKDLDTTSIDFVEPAHAPLKPSKPQKGRVLAASVVLGGGLGLFTIWILNAFNSSLRTVDQAQRVTRLPILSAIPDDRQITGAVHGKRRIKTLHALKEASEKTRTTEGVPPHRVQKGGKIDPLVVLSEPGGPLAESIRSLRAALTMQARQREREMKTVLITSAVPGEGKSFVASNLAIAFAAQEGLRTLLIDADLRLPAVERMFLPDDVRGGLSDVLHGAGDWSLSVTDSGIHGLHLMVAGMPAPNPAELLSGSAFASLLESVGEEYDRIIVDSAPVNPVSDTLLLASLMDSVVLVTRAGKTPQNAIFRARDALEDAGGGASGLVLNRLPRKAGLIANPYFYYYHLGGSGYGKSYGTAY